MDGTTWKNAQLVALDLEGTGAQDRDNEAILEIAVVPITGGRPSLANSYTLVSPGRPTGTALLLTALIDDLPAATTLACSQLLRIAGLPLTLERPDHGALQQTSLLDNTMVTSSCVAHDSR